MELDEGNPLITYRATTPLDEDRLDQDFYEVLLDLVGKATNLDQNLLDRVDEILATNLMERPAVSQGALHPRPSDLEVGRQR